MHVLDDVHQQVSCGDETRIQNGSANRDAEPGVPPRAPITNAPERVDERGDHGSGNGAADDQAELRRERGKDR